MVVKRLTKNNKRFLVIFTLSSLCFLKFLNIQEEKANFLPGRWLSINLGDGKCQWTPPKPIPPETELDTTLIVSYPGSGKRLTFRLIEGITGQVTADDWNFSKLRYRSPTIKSSYPHPQSRWDWSRKHKVAQSIMILRNPRFAFESYASTRFELGFSDTWMQSFKKMGKVYTTRPTQESWVQFRDENIVREMDLWTWMIDYWMHNGQRRNDGDGNSYYEKRCGRDIPDCRPVALLSFERLYNKETGPSELEKLANAYEGMRGVNVIDKEARECVYKAVMDKAEQIPQFHNANRDQSGHTEMEFRYHFRQLHNDILNGLYKVRNKYGDEAYVEENKEQIAWWLVPELLTIIDGYIDEVTAEFNFEWAYYNYTHVPTPL